MLVDALWCNEQYEVSEALTGFCGRNHTGFCGIWVGLWADELVLCSYLESEMSPSKSGCWMEGVSA